ncbi:methyl-accepting chemotaxis sensory transducer [Desulfotomaculum nigrificans CO-1-SRB]|uniref:Methyl-accepting chemotaxis sensory transducer n=1 Tax=Desulfotomaculum nigrificans (strain DSM 14880 / VKM B-2319 / CO-1-SRB) TaxID=868595 RepID=F6B4M0_DESCC|nr:methyl-accepting chemotaxis protein [Desulfotomaculum nigrificans]AEF94132.1 methyl-accepting chemotaxis sensory transducer [Desulfotomaculum nigrificans CO-1-SRB]
MSNCWDYLNCPAERKSQCPAFTENRGLDCWKVPKTLCRGEVQGTVAQKIAGCRQCEFFNHTVINNRFPIKRKIITGFGLVLILLTIVGWLAYTDMNHIKAQYDRLIDQRVLVINQTNHSLILLEKSALDLRNYLITGDQSYLTAHNQALAETSAVLANLRSVIQTEKGKALFKEYEQKFSAFKTYAGNLVNLRQNNIGDNEELTTLKNIQQQTMADKGTVSETVRTAQNLITYVNDLVNKEKADVQKDVNRLVSLIAMIIIAAIILGIVIAFYVSNIIANPIARLEQAAAKVAAGDLSSEEIEIKNRDEVGKLATAFNQMVISLKDLVAHINEKADTVSSTSQQLASTCQQSSASASEAANTLTQLASTVDGMAENTNKVYRSSAAATQSAEAGRSGLEQVEQQMQTIKDSTNRVAKVINELNATSGRITQIVEMITQIAEQTNLLALNAAIEAARAGEQGRGFAVVAEEVRKLAEESGTAAKEIKNLILSMQAETTNAVNTMSVEIQEVEKGTTIVNEVAHSFLQIIKVIEDLNNQMQDVASSAEQISAGVQSVAGTAEEQTAIAEELTASSETLATMAEELKETAARFKLS